jgi:hypothetical protein
MAMDGKRFDAIAVTLATHGSRRQVLRALIGGAFGGLFSRHRIEAATTTTECDLVDPGTVVFRDDFEGGDLPTRWDDVHGLVVETWDGEPAWERGLTLVPGETYVARAKSGGAPTYARTGLGTADGFDDLYFRVRFKVMSRPNNEWVNLLSFLNVNDEPILGLGIDDRGQLRYRNEMDNQPDVVVEGAGSPTVMPPDEWNVLQWHTVQVHLRLADGNGRVEVWFDGTQAPGLSNDETFGVATIGRIQLGESVPRKEAYDVAFDEVVVATGIFQDCGTGAHCCAGGVCKPNDTDNCGSCGHDCPGPLPNARVECNSIGCRFSCNSDSQDCDLDWANGCERQATDSNCFWDCTMDPVNCAQDGLRCLPDLACCCSSRSDLTGCNCSTPTTSARYI